MINLKFMILDYLAAKKSGILDFTQIFLQLIHRQSLYLEGNALQASDRAQCTHG